MEIISLKYDFSFKYLMLNEEIRKCFISDVLGIPLAEIRSVRLANTFLWRKYFRQKQGILDILVELNDDSKVNIELQVRMVRHWDRRSLFYLSKMYTEDLRSGERYEKLKRCICISILDFDLDKSSKYHRVYRMRDEDGEEFSDLFELHVIELNKELEGRDRVDDWIRLINARTEGELDMIQARTKNPGIQAAVREVKVMSLGKSLRALYEARLKEKRDRIAQDDYVWDQGRELGRVEGKEIGMAEGKAEGKAEAVLQLLGEKDTLPKDLRQIIMAEKDMDTLGVWLGVAARENTVSAFREKVGI